MRKLFLIITLLAFIPCSIRADEKLSKRESNLLGKWQLISIQETYVGLKFQSAKKYKEERKEINTFKKRHIGSTVIFNADKKLVFNLPSDTTSYKGRWRFEKRLGDKIKYKTGVSNSQEGSYYAKYSQLELLLYAKDPPLDGFVVGEFSGFVFSKNSFKIHGKKYILHFKRI